MQEQQQNRITSYIGVALIFLILFLWMKFGIPEKPTDVAPTSPDQTQQPAQVTPTNVPSAPIAPPPVLSDTLLKAQLTGKLGAFAPSGTGTEVVERLENELVIIEFTNKGGRIKSVFLKKYLKASADSLQNEIKSPLYLLEDVKNRFDYTLAVNGAASGSVNTSELYFQSVKTDSTLTFRAPVSTGGYFEQTYKLTPGNYHVDYRVATNDLQNVLTNNKLQLTWDNYLDKLEKNQTYEKTMSSVYFKVNDKSADYCDCKKSDRQALGEQPVKWFAHSNQFFNSTLLAQDFSFRDFVGETVVYDNAEPDLKLLRSTANIQIENLYNGSASMLLYSGPNEFDRLRSYHQSLEDIIPFGSSVFGSINRWIIHPIFDFLLWIIGIPGIVILVLTLIVKLILFPLTYRMVLSQSKMAALKPKLDALRKKFGDDQQQMSVESMKLYSEFGVNPLGGCLPVFFQMPIWFALYRFFPAAIEFRQASFLWATDLSSYDVAFQLPFMLPGFGNHLSLFTLIWVVTTLWYTWYSMKQMDNASMNSDQAKIMKYMQYTMPIMFMFFFNTFASGLTCYLCFSNLLNVGQTVFTKRFLIDKDKILAKLEANKNKPKKTSGWRAKLNQAMEESQRLQAEKAKQAKKK